MTDHGALAGPGATAEAEPRRGGVGAWIGGTVLLALAYALAPWSGMIGYAWVWGFGAALFLGLGLALRRASAAHLKVEGRS